MPTSEDIKVTLARAVILFILVVGLIILLQPKGRVVELGECRDTSLVK